jgi:hypothetical protein
MLQYEKTPITIRKDPNYNTKRPQLQYEKTPITIRKDPNYNIIKYNSDKPINVIVFLITTVLQLYINCCI